jgi:hypothetical protein
MCIVKRALAVPFAFGGEEHSGWLPPGAATPLPTPVQHFVLDVEIQSDGSGFLLCWSSPGGDFCGDLWYPSLAEAEAAGLETFGIEPEQWIDCPTE